MKNLNRLLMLFLSTAIVGACAEATEEGMDWPDAEFGIEADGKDDSFAIRPGSKEAEAVLAYVNRDIATHAEGEAFYDILDDVLDKRAARGIIEFRAGQDGTFGTADDRRFATLEELDGVRYVGRTALMRIFGLAEAAGLFNNASIECADYIVPRTVNSRGANYQFNTYASLLELENSKCEIIRGNVLIQINATDLLPPSQRHLTNFKWVKTIEGNLQFEGTPNVTGADFERLERITGNTILRDNNRSMSHTLNFPALVKADNIELTYTGSTSFPSLKEMDTLRTTTRFVRGFSGLETLGSLSISGIGTASNLVQFNELRRVTSLSISRTGGVGDFDARFVGGFEKLREVGSFVLSYGDFKDLTFPSLEEVDRNFQLTFTNDALKGITRLRTVGGSYMVTSNRYAQHHIGPATLERIEGQIQINETTLVEGYNKLEYAGSNISVTSRGGVKGFNALEQTYGSISINVRSGIVNEGLIGFNALVDARSISLDFNNVDGPRDAFKKVKEINGNLHVTKNSRVQIPNFESLEAISAALTLHTYSNVADGFPKLEIVQGLFTIENSDAVNGFESLTRVESGFRLLGSGLRTIPGLQNLRAIGGDIEVARQLPSAELDRFLNQLQEFSGGIFLR